MKSWALAAIFVSAAALAACEGTSDGDGSGGGGGEGGSTGTTTTTTTGTETGTTTTTTTGAACAAEDTAMNCGDVSMGCTACALSGPCSADFAAFQADPDAGALLGCYDACDPADNACFEACDTMYPAAADLYLTVASCVACDNCFTACDGAQLGCQ